ncbi:hypothetical protein BDV27DRAFT_128440 [Aspergillus caelatus]|uniref:AMP-activated protein kinase glycogen-binding domain-containing protein n=1 Tax=Aspergillus caelatus TaxID=61420 RepID=A0A5N7A5C4_9EURO|nr:uncharacterized protein BDV27DRAFT_128440 [Aspergillus caelatus]KAE8364396.1 hypothetical protein BDV27DRAFT_128440 [Aspergillus caelatus]
MGSYTFRWPHDADEVFVTGTFDDWGKTVRLDRKGDIFEKEVPLPATEEKLHYKFVVDGIWTTDHSVPEEDDGNHNINNVLYPDQIRKEDTSSLQNSTAVMAGVAPDSTTAALAAEIPKESRRDILGDAALSSTAPGSTTAELAKHAPLEQRANVPGSFPATPRSEVEQFSVNPIPASSGTGNPIKLKPGEKVPDPSTFNTNTIHSTARTDQAGYEQDASHPLTGGQSNKDTSAFAVPPISNNMIPESSLPMGQASEGSSDPVTIQSAAPTSTTAALAGAVPLESHKKQTVGGSGAPVGDVPEMVRHSMSEAHADPEAAAIQEAVGEKKEMEHELQQKVPVDESRGTPAPTTGVTAATTETAPQATISQPDSAQLSPRATTPTTRPDTTSEAGPTVTTGPETTKTSEVSGPGSGSAAATAGDTGASATKTAEPTHPQDTGVGATKARSSTPPKDTERKDSGSSSGTPSQKKKRNRASAFFHKLKEKLT